MVECSEMDLLHTPRRLTCSSAICRFCLLAATCRSPVVMSGERTALDAAHTGS